MKKIGNTNFGEKFVCDRISTITVIMTFLLACGVLVGAVSAVEAPEIEWQRCLGGSSTDYASSVQQTEDGGYIVVGTTSSTYGDVTGNHGNSDAWVVKLDAKGSIMW